MAVVPFVDVKALSEHISYVACFSCFRELEAKQKHFLVKYM